jgi:uncharacterized protein (DUF362 family)
MVLSRRAAIKLGVAASVAAAWPAKLFAAGYRVGVGRDPDPYAATKRALGASGDWSGLGVRGKTVVIKPNLVAPRSAITGTTTDPEVVRAVVDQALTDGAAEVQIVETSTNGANFTPCGYDFFDTYDPQGRVQLLDLQQMPQALALLPGGMAYHAIYTAEPILGNDVVFVSVGKLKTHTNAVASLAMKNLFGLPTVDRYLSSKPSGRFAMHDRSVHQTVVDLNRLRPVNFAVLDGIWGMEGNGPLFGPPVRTDTVLAGSNALAVDRVAVSCRSCSSPSARCATSTAPPNSGSVRWSSERSRWLAIRSSRAHSPCAASSSLRRVSAGLPRRHQPCGRPADDHRRLLRTARHPNPRHPAPPR